MLRLTRPVWRFDPWMDMEGLGREMESVLFDLSPKGERKYPLINVFTRNDDVVITSEIPGIEPKDINLSVVGDTLTLKGSRRPDEVVNGRKWHRRERGTGNFLRTVRLPYNVDSDRVDASYQKGVLRITLPRAEADKPRKISVKTEE